MNIEPVTKKSPCAGFDELFASLPPLGSSQYFSYLETATAVELPAQVLVRAFRQLCAAGSEEAAQATLARLFAQDDRYGYLKVVRRLARQQLPAGQNWQGVDDLFQAAVVGIVKVLPTSRGALAEKAWVLFCRNCFQDVWRAFYGRRGEKLEIQFLEPYFDEESDEMIYPVEETDGFEAPWHVCLRESNLPWMEAVIEETIAKINDSLTRRVAEDQFSPNPSPISAGRSATSKPPLTEQLGASRYQISRALRSAKARLAAALLADKDHEIDKEWLRNFLRDSD